jgi:hypothetical protein
LTERECDVPGVDRQRMSNPRSPKNIHQRKQSNPCQQHPQQITSGGPYAGGDLCTEARVRHGQRLMPTAAYFDLRSGDLAVVVSIEPEPP